MTDEFEITPMYLELFKLRELPFRLSPDPEFLYLSQAHARAKAYMESTVWFADGFVVMRGSSVQPVGVRLVVRPGMIWANVVRHSIEHQLHVAEMQVGRPSDILRYLNKCFAPSFPRPPSRLKRWQPEDQPRGNGCIQISFTMAAR